MARHNVERRNSERRAFTVTELLVVIAVIGIMMALLLPAVQMVRESGRKASCANNLTQIGKAFTLHAGTFEYYPTAGVSSKSARSIGGNGDPEPYNRQDWGWAYQILPYIEQEGPYKKIVDAEAARMVINAYFCPTRRRPLAREGIDCGLAAQTLRGAIDYAGNSGYGLRGQGGFPAHPDAWINQNGTVIPIRYANTVGGYVPSSERVGPGVPDGDGFTILVGERNYNRQRMADATQQDEDNGYIAGYSWDTIRWGYGTPAKDREDASDFDLRFGSSHNLIAQFVFCDGSVKPISYNVDLAVFQGACAREDGRSPNLE